MTEFDVFVGNHAIIDMEIYDLWLRGLTAEEAVEILLNQDENQKCLAGGVSSGGGVAVSGGSRGRHSSSHDSSTKGSYNINSQTAGFLLADVEDHYRTLAILERFLQNPPNLVEQLNFQLTIETQANLVRKYYEYDESVFREFVGKKLSSRNRGALDDAGDRLGVKVKACRRQFDNVKRVHKQMEDVEGALIDNIQAQFLLPLNLAGQYACMVFIINHRFELTGKRKLNYLTFGDIMYCAQQMMANWTPKGEEGDADLDREFLMELRELKVLLERDVMEEHKAALLVGLRGQVDERAWGDLEANFKNYSRGLINIAHGLNHAREARDIFVDVVEKIVEPAKNLRWQHADFGQFLAQYAITAAQVPAIANSNKLTSVLDRYLTTLNSCLLRLFHN